MGSLEAEITTIDAEISKLQARRAETFSKLDIKRTSVSEFKALISPLKELPTELISRIFEVYAHGANTLDLSVKSPKPPWFLGHICSRWRQVALTSPNLWNFFIFGGNTVTPSTDIAKELRHRAGASKIACLFEWYNLNQIFKTLGEDTRRLRCLTFDLKKTLLSSEEVSTVSLTSLEALRLTIHSKSRNFVETLRPISAEVP